MERTLQIPGITSFLSQEARRARLETPAAESTERRLGQLLPLCGESSRAQKAAKRIAKVLLHSECRPLITAPCCPDYSHENGTYTFRGLGNGISLLTGRHIEFLRQVQNVLPEARITLLIADQEAGDPELCAACRVSTEEFAGRVRESITAASAEVAPLGWEVQAFTQYFPRLCDDADALAEELLADPKHRSRLTSEAASRAEMYRRIRTTFTTDELMRRTARTAAQYLLLGREAAERPFLLCNHTTTNLAWYAESGAAVLHNPISVY